MPRAAITTCMPDQLQRDIGHGRDDAGDAIASARLRMPKRPRTKSAAVT